MMEVQKDQMDLIAPLFEGVEDSMVKACLQGYMGKAYVKNPKQPQAALIISGEYSFFGGEPNSDDAEYLVRNLFTVNTSSPTIGIYAEDRPDWERILMSVPENHPQVVPRFGIVQKDYAFDCGELQKFVDTLPEGFDLVPFDQVVYDQAMDEEWSREFCETFSSATDFLTRGFGYAVLKDGKLVSGASSMTVYDGGIEIQVATDIAYRKKGLALPCAAALIQECMRRKLRPCWDAANLISKKMALKLGYEYKGEYITIQMSPQSIEGKNSDS